MRTAAFANTRLRLPPGDPDVPVPTSIVFDEDVHVMLSVPHYDFNWQLFSKELFVSRSPGDIDFNEVVVIAGREVRFHDLRQLRQRLLKLLEHLAIVPIQDHIDKDSIR
jgi:hypothetical protein